MRFCAVDETVVHSPNRCSAIVGEKAISPGHQICEFVRECFMVPGCPRCLSQIHKLLCGWRHGLESVATIISIPPNDSSKCCRSPLSASRACSSTALNAGSSVSDACKLNPYFLAKKRTPTEASGEARPCQQSRYRKRRCLSERFWILGDLSGDTNSHLLRRFNLVSPPLRLYGIREQWLADSNVICVPHDFIGIADRQTINHQQRNCSPCMIQFANSKP